MRVHFQMHKLCMHKDRYMQAGMNLFFLIGQAAWISFSYTYDMNENYLHVSYRKMYIFKSLQAGMNLFFLIGQAAWIPETKPRPEGGAATVGLSSIMMVVMIIMAVMVVMVMMMVVVVVMVMPRWDYHQS